MNRHRVYRSEKADEPRTFLMSRITFAVCFFVSVGLIIGGFFVPPMGVIDGSCLTAVGELLLFPTLLYGFRAVELGMTLKFSKGDTTIEISQENKRKHDIEPSNED
jgi:predicted Kef-type K+ transport protein